MIDISEITTNLVQDERGVWVSDKHSGISYPDEGNALIFPAEDRLFWFRHRNRCISSLVQRCSPDKTLFDIGGGNGVVAKALQDRGIETVLLEPGETGVENALNRGLSNVICATLGDANFKDGSLPSAGIFDVLEHIEDDLNMLVEIHRLLMPNGMLYISVPAYQWLWSHEDDFAKHYRRYTLKRLEKVLLKANFKIEYSTYIFSFLPPLSLFTRTIPYRLKLDRWLSVDREKAVRMDLGTLGKMVEWVLQPESLAIRKGSSLPIGGSCLVAASRSG